MQAMARMERRDSDADSVEGVCTDNRSGEGAIEVRRETGQGPPERISPHPHGRNRAERGLMGMPGIKLAEVEAHGR